MLLASYGLGAASLAWFSLCCSLPPHGACLASGFLRAQLPARCARRTARAFLFGPLPRRARGLPRIAALARDPADTPARFPSKPIRRLTAPARPVRPPHAAADTDLSVMEHPIAWDPSKYLSFAGMRSIFDKQSYEFDKVPFPFKREILRHGGGKIAGITDDNLKEAFGEHYKTALPFVKMVAVPEKIQVLKAGRLFGSEGADDLETKVVWTRQQSTMKAPEDPENPFDHEMTNPERFWNDHKDYAQVLFAYYNPLVDNFYYGTTTYVILPNTAFAVPLRYDRDPEDDSEDRYMGKATVKTVGGGRKTFEFYYNTYSRVINPTNVRDIVNRFCVYDVDTFAYITCDDCDIEMLCNIDGALIFHSELMGKHLPRLGAFGEDTWKDFCMANMQTLAAHNEQLADKHLRYWQRRAHGAESLLNAMCKDEFDGSYARKAVVEAHNMAHADKQVYEDIPFKPRPAPLCRAVEKVVSQIMEVCPSGQKYAECVATYGTEGIGKKRKRPNSAPPLL